MLEVSLSGVGTVLRLERNAWSRVKSLRHARNDYAPSLSLGGPSQSDAWSVVK